LARDEALVGASSIANDPAADLYDEWVYLPPIHDPSFSHRFREILARFHVGAVFCPHPMIYDRLQMLSETLGPDLHMANPHPVKERERTVGAYVARARTLDPYIRICAEAGSPLTDLEVAGLLRAAELVPGQSNDTKLASLMAVFPTVPEGDVVEVGAFWGRSAFTLAWLASRYDVGAVLAVDAWSADLAVQRESPELVQRDAFAQDWEIVHQGFVMNVLPVAPGRLSYLRLASQEAAARYPELETLESPPFGPVRYCGRIALLHIDGNHGHEAVRADVAAWRGFVRSSGWIILDDYVWLHGDGPQRVGDALLAELEGRVARSFVAGKALFLQLA
jgi:hypothetical protein